MRYGIEVVPVGPFSDPRAVVRLGQAAEAAGWDALSTWDHLLFPFGAGDPWVSLAAVAAVTERLRLVTAVAALPRYPPQLLARTVAALDQLSGGRVTLGVGLGIEPDVTPFGGPSDPRVRAGMLDEGLELLEALLTGDEVTHRGAHHTAEGVRLLPTPVQQPRVPVWIGGSSGAALGRAARWDGWIIGAVDETGTVTLPPEALAEHVARITAARTSDAHLDVAVTSVSEPGDATRVEAYAAAGATWWFECIFPLRGSETQMLERIAAGPPSVG
jgi:alkanesulfonate monooxygenase SsuD/methylene tetrahydromethanopterin reductase-like flavin-dependent oxidoreductase (luciferase family)